MFLITAIVDAMRAARGGLPGVPREPAGLEMQVGTTVDDRVWLRLGDREYVLGAEAALWLADRLRHRAVDVAFLESGMPVEVRG